VKIKRYTAPSMREALAQVRAEQGPDAVILSSRRVEDAMEVIAAVDYDRDLFLEASRPPVTPPAAHAQAEPAPVEPAAGAPATLSTGAKPATEKPATEKPAEEAAPERAAPEKTAAAATLATPGTPRAAAVPAARARTGAPAVPSAAAPGTVRTAPPKSPEPPLRSARPAVPAAVPPEPLAIALVRRELKDLRTLMESELAQLSWHDQRVRDPLRARVLEAFAGIDVAPDVALELAARAPRTTRLEDPSPIPLALLVRHLPVVERIGTVAGGVIAVVGPTGAGKTTTIAKLAARYSLKHGSEGLALVSTDGYRVGAREQLRWFARALNAPLYTAENGRDLERTLEKLRQKRLVLIDTAGMAPSDARLGEQLTQLALGAVRARVLLALPAQAEVHTLESIVRGFAPVAPAACVLTKVDETASLGAALSVILRHRLRIAYLSDGQRVPEDLHAAHQRRIWLVRRALKLRERAPARSAQQLAQAFGRAVAHA